MKLYKIRDWNKIYENSRSRTVKDLSWVPVPNGHDGENYSNIVAHPHGPIIFSAWILILEIASKCEPRGTLIRGNGLPHTVTTLSGKCRAPVGWFEIGIEYLEKYTDWLEVEEVADGCRGGDGIPTPSHHPSAEEGKGMEGNGKKEAESLSESEITVLTHSRIALYLLNEKSGRHFRETTENLTVISARLKEPGVDIEGVKKMIIRQCALWKNNPEMSEYMRPETLFRKSKFEAYYAAKDIPVTPEKKRTGIPNL